MRCYAAADLHAALTEQGYSPAEQTGSHDLYIRQSDVLVMPKPSAEGLHNADIVDQIIADRWVPISAGRLQSRIG